MTHNPVLQKHAADKASALLFLNRFGCASRARRGQPRRSVLEGGAPRRRAVSSVLHGVTTRNAVAAGRVLRRPTLCASRRSPPRRTPSTLECDELALARCVLAMAASGFLFSLLRHAPARAAAPLRGMPGAEPLPAPFRFPAFLHSSFHTRKSVRSVFIRGWFACFVRWESRGWRSPASRSTAPEYGDLRECATSAPHSWRVSQRLEKHAAALRI